MRLCKINPKNECHRQGFSELSQNAQPTEPSHCTALLLHNTTKFLHKSVMEIMKIMEIVEIMEMMELMELMEMIELIEMIERGELVGVVLGGDGGGAAPPVLQEACACSVRTRQLLGLWGKEKLKTVWRSPPGVSRLPVLAHLGTLCLA